MAKPIWTFGVFSVTEVAEHLETASDWLEELSCCMMDGICVYNGMRVSVMIHEHIIQCLYTCHIHQICLKMKHYLWLVWPIQCDSGCSGCSFDVWYMTYERSLKHARSDIWQGQHCNTFWTCLVKVLTLWMVWHATSYLGDCDTCCMTCTTCFGWSSWCFKCFIW